MRKSVLANLVVALTLGTVLPVPAQTPTPTPTAQERADQGDNFAAFEFAVSLLKPGAPDEDIARGLDYLSKAATSGVPDALVRLGDYTRDGAFGITRDTAAAAALYERASGLGNSGATVRLAMFYRSGVPGVEKDLERAAALLDEAIAKNNTGAMQMLAQMLVDGTMPVDQPKARALFQQAIDAGDAGAAVPLAREMSKGRFEGSGAVEALALLRPLADQGNNNARRLIAEILRAGGEGLDKDPAGALAAFRTLAETGDGGAARAAAEMLIKGEAGTADFVGGIALLEPLAVNGDAGIALQIGDYYANPAFGNVSSERAIAFFERARELGNGSAVMRLADLYRKGASDLGADVGKAAELLREAAGDGNVSAMRSLAAMLLDGSVPKDPAAARALLDQAISTGDQNAPVELAREMVKGSFDDAGPADALALVAPLAETGNAGARRVVADLLRNGAEGVEKNAATSLAAYRALGESGDPWAARAAAEMLVKGEAGTADFAAGIAVLRPFAEKGDAGVAATIGDYFADARWGGQSAEEAIRYYEQAITLGNAGTVMRLADLYRRGTAAYEPDPERAAEVLRTAAASGNSAAMRGLAAMLLDGTLPEDQAEARALFQQAIDSGDTDASVAFAREISKGRFDGLGADDAVALVKLLAEGGHPGAKRLVADLLRSGGEGLASDPTGSLAAYRELGEAGDPWAARAAAEMMIKGETGTADFAGGVALLTPFADKGDAGILTQIGDYFANPSFGNLSSAQAITYYERAIALGDRPAVIKLAELYRKGAADMPADPSAAQRYLEDAAAAGDNGARRALASMLLDGTLAPDPAGAVTLYEQAIANGDAAAVLTLANAYLNGTGLPKDASKAVAVLAASAEAGNAAAMVTLADVLRDGADGVPTDATRAFRLIEQAVALNDTGAVRRMADMLAKGEGVERDIEAAVAILEPIATAGDNALALQIGDFFARTEYEAIDADRAIAFYSLAADRGNVPAKLKLGDLYRRGLGTLEADPQRAMAIYREAAETGDSGAIRRTADMLLDGDEAQRREGFELYRRLSEGGDLWGSIILADLYAKGRGVEADGEKALLVLEPFVAKQQPNARVALADILRSGAPGVASNETEARRIFQVAADEGDPNATKRLADMMARGQGGQTDTEGAAALLSAMADNGDVGAMLQLGDMLSKPEFGIGDAASAIASYERAVTFGNSAALVRLADVYRSGGGGAKPDPMKAAEYLEDAVALGDNGARQRLGRMLLDGSLAADPGRGIALLEEAADAGDRGATLTLATTFARGEGVDADGERALALLQPLIDEEQVNAIITLADLYRNSSAGIAQDPAKAVTLYEQAIELGNLGAARRLGEMLVRGENGQPDFDRGTALVSLAAEAGDVGALLQLGDFYSRPDYGRTDPALAAEYYQRAADAGNAAGFTRLGDLYRRGVDDLEADAETAAQFYEQAVGQGDNGARRNLAALLLEGGNGEARERAVALYEEALAGGDANSALALANYFADGKHAKADYARAKGYYEAAVALGNRSAPSQWGNLLANGPLAGKYRSEGIEVLNAAVAAKAPNALLTLSRLQMSGSVPGANAKTAIAALMAAADQGDASAAQMLVQTLRDGYSDTVRRAPSQARKMLELYGELFPEEQRRAQLVLMDGVEATSGAQYAAMLEGFRGLTPGSQSNVLGTLRWRQQNAHVYLMQSILTDYGYYSGKLTGLLTGATITAFSKACRVVMDKASCDRGPLSGEASPTLGLLMAEPKPVEDAAETPA